LARNKFCIRIVRTHSYGLSVGYSYDLSVRIATEGATV